MGKGSKHGHKGLSKKAYFERLEALQLELNHMARWLQATGNRIVVVVEGRDTAGKGGAIGAISNRLNPRQCRIVALGRPDERERTQWYFQRYVPHLPAAGEMVLFDRSWYNRAGVEQVMGFSTPKQVEAFLDQTPRFERLLVDDGVLLFKYWLTVDQVRQEERFAERVADPMKRWKLSPIDVKARDAVRRLHQGAGGDARSHAHQTRALDAGGLQRPAAGPAGADTRPARSPARRRCPGHARPLSAACGQAEKRTIRRPPPYLS